MTFSDKVQIKSHSEAPGKHKFERTLFNPLQYSNFKLYWKKRGYFVVTPASVFPTQIPEQVPGVYEQIWCLAPGALRITGEADGYD